jgi:uncharacterized membrane protein YeaQ/YmgE (transglycosylase-associated protein family)
MNAADLLLTALVAIVFGTLAQLTSGYSRGGWIVNFAFGFIGALAGVVVSREFNLPEIYNITVKLANFPVIYSVLGSVIFLASVGFFVKPNMR